jgi:hypothetical protein
MGMTTIYKEDYTDYGWSVILNDFNLPIDTDEICVKHVSHITQSMRDLSKEKQNASND